MLTMFADTAQEYHVHLVADLQQQYDSTVLKARRYETAVANGGRIPGVISGIRKKDVSAAWTEAAVLNALLRKYDGMHIRPKSENPFKLKEATKDVK